MSTHVDVVSSEMRHICNVVEMREIAVICRFTRRESRVLNQKTTEAPHKL